MTTTVELPDDLFVSARKAAAERRTTRRDLIERGLRRELAEPKAERRQRRIQWVTVQGGLPPGLDGATQLNVTGPRVFDLQIALTAADTGATEMWTHDAGFVRLPGLPVHDPPAGDAMH